LLGETTETVYNAPPGFSMYRILYVGQDRSKFLFLRDNLPLCMKLERGHEKVTLQTSIDSVKPHGIILPLLNPGPDDFSLLKMIIQLPRAPGVIITANYMSAAQAVSCMRFGAYDCLVGPMSGEVIAASLNRMIQPEVDRENEDTGRLLSGKSSIIKALHKRLLKYADLPYPVLISGETGSGKDLAAKTIHSMGKRRNRPFIAVNCATYTDELLGSEIFGSSKGAFTGSIDKPGLFEASNGGTLFLDEIGEMSIRGQASLLRIIEEGYVRRMGSHKTRAVDVRIIAATNQNLRQCMKLGTFRNDLFYRLNLLGVTIPPLRKRKEDIPQLSMEYLNTLSPETPWKIENRALSILFHYHWPGNVRELQSVLLKASITARNGGIRAADLTFPENDDLIGASPEQKLFQNSE